MDSGQIRTPLSCERVRESLDGYSLGALEGAERAQVETHLERCLRCRAQAEGLADLAAVLSQQVPQVSPPPALRERVLTQVRSESRGGRPIFPRLSWRPSLSAAAALVAVGSLAWALSLQVQLGAQQAQLARLGERAERYEQVVGVLRSQHMRVHDLKGEPDASAASGRMVMDPTSQWGMLMVWNLPPVLPDRAYQVWFVSESGRKSGGLVRPDEQGSGYFFIEVPRDLNKFQAVGLTEEPARGSPGPTGRRVLRGEL